MRFGTTSDRLGRAGEIDRAYRDGEVICKEGDPGREMFVIRSGHVLVRRRGEDVVRLGRGDVFGEMSLLESLPRDADAIADGDTEVLVLGPGALTARLRRDPTFALELLQTLSKRVRTLNDRLGDQCS
ncbi:MAG: cyclic nucleotide-binding domain-containing protein [Actinomycetota bacterium]|nr:cyclic nucleotide-binding domain-containing protein [Actinomycetota bacterium]